jgi:hypothetical protein
VSCSYSRVPIRADQQRGSLDKMGSGHPRLNRTSNGHDLKRRGSSP